MAISSIIAEALKPNGVAKNPIITNPKNIDEIPAAITLRGPNLSYNQPDNILDNPKPIAISMKNKPL